MPVITINGVIGSGTLEIGHLVAQNLGINYVDRYIFSEAARLVGSPIGQLIEKEAAGGALPRKGGPFHAGSAGTLGGCRRRR